MKLNRKLNLVIELWRDKDTVAYVHSTPIGRPVFEQFYMVIAKTFSKIYQGGLGVSSGPAVAALVLREKARESGEEYFQQVELGLFGEMHRLCSYISLTENGWESVPLDEALKRQLIDADEAGEVENALAFFTVVSCMHRKAQLPGVLGIACELWNARVVSSNSTEFASSLTILTSKEDTGQKATQ